MAKKSVMEWNIRISYALINRNALNPMVISRVKSQFIRRVSAVDSRLPSLDSK